MRAGFIGTGVITSAIVTGLCTGKTPFDRIYLSPRNEKKAAALADQFSRVTVCPSNQAVVDHADTLVLAFLPQYKKEILGDLQFSETQTIVHLLADTCISEITPLVKPASQVVRAVPLPCVSIHTGPVAMFPENENARHLFDKLGTIIVPPDEGQLEALAVITALMGPFYDMVNTVVKWAQDQSVPGQTAADYTASMFEALSKIVRHPDSGDLNLLLKESLTPGGLNELAMYEISAHGGFHHVAAALSKVANRGK